jgi:hypothetical protein
VFPAAEAVELGFEEPLARMLLPLEARVEVRPQAGGFLLFILISVDIRWLPEKSL